MFAHITGIRQAAEEEQRAKSEHVGTGSKKM